MATKHGHGEGSSPVLKGNTIIINWDHEKESAIYAIDKNTGKNIWKVDRKEVTSWSTPIIVKSGEKNQVIVSSTQRIRGYDINNGKGNLGMLWNVKQCGCFPSIGKRKSLSRL